MNNNAQCIYSSILKSASKRKEISFASWAEDQARVWFLARTLPSGPITDKSEVTHDSPIFFLYMVKLKSLSVYLVGHEQVMHAIVSKS